MRNRFVGVASLWVAAVLTSPACLAVAPAAGCLVSARASLAALVSGRFSAAAADFSPSMAKALSPAKLKQTWSIIEAQAGRYVGHAAARQQAFRGRQVTVMPVTFAKLPLDFVASCDAAGRIEMFDFLKPDMLSKPQPVQPHVLADGVRVEPLAVPSKFGPLRGALTLPPGKGLFPAVVLVGGSGPSDLNETVGGSKPFRDIADGLARLGVASLRYDKRQVDYPLQVAANPDLTVDEEATDDALSAARVLAKQPAIDPQRVFVVGHSEGGMLAPRIGNRDPGLAGLILLAAPARPLLTVMAEQVREQGARLGWPNARIAASEKALAGEAALLDAANSASPPAGSFDGVPQTWWLSLHDYHPVTVARTLRLPMLILQGGSDFQVSPTRDFDVWKHALAGRPNVAFHLFPGLSHLFTPAGKTLTPADYAKPEHVDPAVIAVIAGWIKAQPAK